MSESTYDRIRKERCEWCRQEVPIDLARKRRREDGKDERGYYGNAKMEPPQHKTGYTDYSSFNVPNKWEPCTAPSPEAVIEEQAVELAAEKAERESAERERDEARIAFALQETTLSNESFRERLRSELIMIGLEDGKKLSSANGCIS